MKDVLTGFTGSSGYPTVCGNYGICTSYFWLINDKLPNHGYAPYLLLANYPPDVNVRICERNSVLVCIQNAFAFVLTLCFCVGIVHCSQDSQVWILANFSLKRIPQYYSHI